MALQAGKSAKNKKTNKSSKSVNKKKRQGDYIFALDTGTRTVVGILGQVIDGIFHIIDHEVMPHTSRAMTDGQIEDINAVADVVSKVKKALEERNNIKLNKVCIAAAGRALKTQCVTVDVEIPSDNFIDEDMVKSFEMDAISKAQSEIDKTQKPDEVVSFYCVGHSVVSSMLDNYPMKSLIGHKGSKVTLQLIAAFLPSIVVESLYAVMEKNRLKVDSLTLEPIAAMNVIIPPEVRLINIALVDIGAGTSDIAVAKDGSVVAYAMATTAGDEITEDIIKKFLVDFDTAENMKLSADGNDIEYKDILGLTHTVTTEEFFKTIYSSVDALADTIAQNILNINKEAPAAIFLVGGGSLIPDLPKIVAEKLGVPEARVAVGGNNFIKTVALGDNKLNGPEYVTPIGIGMTATIQSGYDFSTVSLNNKDIRIFDTKNLTVFDVLIMGGYKTKDIIGRSGISLNFVLNGEKQLLKAEIAKPSEIKLNGKLIAVNTPVSHGDKITIIPACDGKSPQVFVRDLVGDTGTINVMFDGVACEAGNRATVNGRLVESDYQIGNNDNVVTSSVVTINDLLLKLEYHGDAEKFLKGKAVVSRDAVLSDGDIITPYVKSQQTAEVITEEKSQPEIIKEAVQEPEKSQEMQQPEETENTPEISVIVNGHQLSLPEKEDNLPHTFLEVFKVINFDVSSVSGRIVTQINGQDAKYTSVINENDRITVTFD